jgi:hypothetical protein
MGYDATAGFIAGSPELVSAAESTGASPAMAWGAQIARGWMCLLSVLVVGFVYTFFWSSATIAYFILRHSVDANDFDEVHIDEGEERDELLPLVGTAAIAEAQRCAPIGASASPAPASSPAPPPVDLAP